MLLQHTVSFQRLHDAPTLSAGRQSLVINKIIETLAKGMTLKPWVAVNYTDILENYIHVLTIAYI